MCDSARISGGRPIGALGAAPHLFQHYRLSLKHTLIWLISYFFLLTRYSGLDINDCPMARGNLVFSSGNEASPAGCPIRQSIMAIVETCQCLTAVKSVGKLKKLPKVGQPVFLHGRRHFVCFADALGSSRLLLGSARSASGWGGIRSTNFAMFGLARSIQFLYNEYYPDNESNGTTFSRELQFVTDSDIPNDQII